MWNKNQKHSLISRSTHFALMSASTTTIYNCTLDSAAREFAERNLGETDTIRNHAILEIRQWLNENPNLNARDDARSILAFLRGCKFNIDRTKEKLANFYRMRTELPEWFARRDPQLAVIRELVQMGVFVPLRRYQDNRLIVIIRTAAHDPKVYTQNDVFKTGMMLLDIAALEDELVTIYGVTAIFDMQGVTLGHARQLPPSVIKKVVHAWQNYYCRPKHLEFVNAPTYVNVVLRIFKGFMSEKLRERVNVHFGGLGSLHKVVDRENLPYEYGGTDGPLADVIQYWCDKVLSYKDWFVEDEKYKASLL